MNWRQIAPCALLLSSLLISCGGSVPAVGKTRDSGQSSLMGQSFAGANKCSPNTHERPFVVEWDATDSASFEALAASDVVFVKYQGCELTVLDGCNDESIKGSFGAYRPVQWTSGAVEKVDIGSEGDLYAKLPLSVATLGGRVAAGETFHMEYYVAGVKTATRGAIYRDDISRVRACKEATHFVYGYNLGAFALASTKDIQGEVGATVWGIGAGGHSKSSYAAEKKGGQLTSCTGDSAKEVESCKAPIRLTLREISDGANPDVEARTAPETDAALNAAGKIDRERDDERSLNALIRSATSKMNAGDGKGCLSDLDASDKLQKNELSTDPRGYTAQTRAQCLMLSGQCDPGRTLYRKYMEIVMVGMPPESLDAFVLDMAAKTCDASAFKTPRERAHKFATDLNLASTRPTSLAVCKTAFTELKKLKVELTKTPLAPGDRLDIDFRALGNAPTCFGRAGDCAAAEAAFNEQYPNRTRAEFERNAPVCVGK